MKIFSLSDDGLLPDREMTKTEISFLLATEISFELAEVLRLFLDVCLLDSEEEACRKHRPLRLKEFFSNAKILVAKDFSFFRIICCGPQKDDENSEQRTDISLLFFTVDLGGLSKSEAVRFISSRLAEEIAKKSSEVIRLCQAASQMAESCEVAKALKDELDLDA